MKIKVVFIALSCHRNSVFDPYSKSSEINKIMPERSVRIKLSMKDFVDGNSEPAL
jgi:hypothetical protein